MATEERLPDVIELILAGRDREAALRGANLDTQPRSNEGHMDALIQFAQLGPALGVVVARIAPEQLDAPTPCADFTVRGVLEHMIGGATMFAAAYRGEAPVEADLTDPLSGIQGALGGAR